MVNGRDTLQPERWALSKSLENEDWYAVEKFCIDHFQNLSMNEFRHYIKAKFKLKKFLECYKLCTINDSDEENLIMVKCNFKLRCATNLKDKSMITASINLYLSYFPDAIEPKIHLLRSYYSNQNYDSCLLLSKTILSVKKSNYYATLFQARSMTKIGIDYNGIMESWQSLLLISENNLEALNNIARIYFVKLDINEAEKYADNCLSLNPDYVPAKKTKQKILDYINNETSSMRDSNFRQMYGRGLYSEIMTQSGGIDNCKNWDSEETIFVLRSLNREKKYDDVLKIYYSIMPEIQSSGATLNEIIDATINLGFSEQNSELMLILRGKSIKEYKSSILYLRNLIYYENNQDYISDEILFFISIYGDQLLARIVQYILKSGKYDIITLISDGEMYSDVLNPITGSLKERIGPIKYSIIWEKMSKKLIPLLGEYGKNIKINNILENYVDPRDAYFQFVSPELSYSGYADLVNLDISSIKKIFQDIDDNTDAIDINSLRGSVCICTNKSIMSEYFIEHYSLTDFTHIEINSLDNKPSATISRYENGVQFTNSIHTIVKDPRIILGRFFSLLHDFPRSSKFSISWLIEEFINMNSQHIFIQKDFLECMVATRIIGYRDSNVTLLDEIIIHNNS